MKIGLRIFLGYFLIVGLAGFFVMRVFVNEVKPGVRQAMEDTLVDTANVLAQLATNDMRSGHIADGEFAHSIDALATRNVQAKIWNFRKKTLDYRVYVTDARGTVVYDSAGRDIGKDFSRWNDVYLTLQGKYGARTTRNNPQDDSSSVMHVAAPIKQDGKIIGVLTIAKANQRMQPFIENSQNAILKQGWTLLGLSFLIGIIATVWLSNALSKLGNFAKAVTAGERIATPDLGNNEIGDLGRVLGTMRERLDGKQYVEQYVQTLAHEMKAPITAIRGAAEILESEVPAPDRIRFMRHIDMQSRRLIGMIDKMLALAAVEHRQTLENTELLDMVALVREVAESLESHLAQKKIQLIWNIDPMLPAISGDRFLLGQAVSNLLDNAIAFSPVGGVIRLQILHEGKYLIVCVTDEGPGIPDFARDRVFERFYSLPRPNGGRSSGLGLSFVREVAALHQGSINIENHPPQGAQARLRLPISS